MKKESPYAFCYFVLNDDRKKLYDRIDARVDQMVEEGLYEEVKGLLADGIPRSATSMQALGYKEMADHICGGLSAGGSHLSDQTGYQTFCKTPADMVPPGAGCHMG